MAPLRNEMLDFAFWRGPDGVKNVYFTGNLSKHVCDCYFSEEGCADHDLLDTACNCDSNIPVPLQDTGIITNMQSLPIMSISFGGLSYNIQSGSFRLGRLV